MSSVTDFLSDLSHRIAEHAASHARPPAPEPRLRPPSIVRSSLRGDVRSLEAQPEWLLLDEMQRVIRFFVSSTFDDTRHERDVLICCVLPALQQYARSVGFEVVMSEMRFGIRKSSSDDNKTTEICMSELERCLQSSAGISYILLSCNRYGFRMPPRRIPACDMDALLSCMAAAEQRVALDYYALDDNVIRTPRECYSIGAGVHSGPDVPGPAYVIKNANVLPHFWERFGSLQSALRGAASRYWPDAAAHACDACSQHPSKFFSFSITEEEVSRGLLWRSPDLIHDSVLVFQRTLHTSSAAALHLMNASSPELKNYVDLSSDKTAVDLGASRCLEVQQQMIARALSQYPLCMCKFDPLEWQAGKGVDPLHPPHAEYLKRFAELCVTRLLHSIDTAYSKLAVEKHAEMSEAIFHINFARERSSKFAHTPTTLPVTDALQQYLAAGCGRAHNNAFVICGASGSGKTFLMAQAAYSEARAIHGVEDAAMICRFLGTSPAASSALSLLKSICNQLAALSSQFLTQQSESDGWETVSDSENAADSDCCSEPRNLSDGSQFDDADFEQLQVYFKHALQNWSRGRLVIFLDSLDQLDDSLGGRRLNWLPTHDLAPGVRLVLSTLPDDASPADGKPFACWSTLRARYSDLSCFIEVQPVDDIPLLFLHLMKFQKQKLSPAQLAVVEAAVKKSPKTQTPLVVTILATRLSEWPSYAALDPDTIDTSSVRALIIQEFKALGAKHGPELVRAALSFITLAKDGVSETELSEMLSLDDDVLASVYEWWVPPVRTLPTSPLTMLLADLKPYLTRGGATSSSGLIKWYHRQFWEAADDYFLRNTGDRLSRHTQLSEFFLGTWSNRSKAYNDRLRAAVQKKVPGEQSGDRRVRAQPLCMREGHSIFETKNGIDAANERRCREAVHHLLAAGLFLEAADELCNFEGICARVLCGEGLAVKQQLLQLQLHLKELVYLSDVRALQQLRRVEHFSRWLQRDITSIATHPQTEIFNTCSRQPETSLARKDLFIYLQRSSSTFSFETKSRPCYRSFVLGASSQEFDACVAELQYHQREVNCVVYSPDNSMLASASMDNTVAIWNASTGMLEGVIRGHDANVNCVAWAPDSRHIVTGSSDSTARVWDTFTLKMVASLSHEDDIDAVDWSSRGSYIASGCCATESSRAKRGKNSGHTITIWDATKFEPIAYLRGHKGCVLSVAFDCTERRLASGSEDMTIRIWDLQSRQQIALLSGHTGNVSAVAFDFTGNYLASCSHDRSVRIWDAVHHEEVAALTGHTERVNAISWDRSGKYVASGAGVNKSPCFDTTIKVWDVHARKTVTTLTGCKFNVNTIAFDYTGRYIASACSCEKSVCIWDLKAPMLSHKFNSNYFNLAWSCSSGLIAASKLTFNSEMKIKWQHGKLLGNLQRLTGHESSSEDFKIQVFDPSTGITIAEKSGHSLIVSSIDFDSEGKRFASGSWDCSVRLWDTASFQEVAVLRSCECSCIQQRRYVSCIRLL